MDAAPPCVATRPTLRTCFTLGRISGYIENIEPAWRRLAEGDWPGRVATHGALVASHEPQTFLPHGHLKIPLICWCRECSHSALADVRRWRDLPKPQHRHSSRRFRRDGEPQRYLRHSKPSMSELIVVWKVRMILVRRVPLAHHISSSKRPPDYSYTGDCRNTNRRVQ